MQGHPAMEMSRRRRQAGGDALNDKIVMISHGRNINTLYYIIILLTLVVITTIYNNTTIL